jgi:polysaccharide biosynthesis/export protein
MIRKGLQVGLLSAAGMMLCACKTPAPRGEKFEPRANQSQLAMVTNLSAVEVTNTIKPEWRQAPTNFYTLGPGDRLEIEIVNDINSRAMTTVGPDGKIYFNLLPGIDVWGMTLQQAKDRLEQELAKYVVSPQIGLQLRGIDSKRVWLLGRVAKPGVYAMGAPMTVLESISLAGGTMTTSLSGTTEDLADLSHAFLIRNGERLPIDMAGLVERGDMTQNIFLQPDDFVYFPSSSSRDIYLCPRPGPHSESSQPSARGDSGISDCIGRRAD